MKQLEQAEAERSTPAPTRARAFHAQRVEAIKKMVEAGRYPLNSDRIAAAMVEEAELIEARRLRPTRT